MVEKKKSEEKTTETVKKKVKRSGSEKPVRGHFTVPAGSAAENRRSEAEREDEAE